MEVLLKEKLKLEIDNHLLPGGIRIKDSTRWNLPKNLAKEFPGTGGAGSPATICVQYEFELLSSKVLKLELKPGKYSDQTESKNDVIEKGALYIRDLGYVSLDYMSRINNLQSFYLNRLSPTTEVYVLKDNVYQRLDFEECRKELKGSSQTLEKNVYLGAIKLPSRLFIERIPDEEYENRKRGKDKFNKKYGHTTSKELITRMGLNIFVSNLPAAIYTKDIIKPLYACRWQIELLFKTWKSVMKIKRIKEGKPERIKCDIYARLIIAAIHMALCSHIGGLEIISPHKLLNILKKTKEKFREYFWGKSENWIEIITKETLELTKKEFKNKRLKMSKVIEKIRFLDVKFRTEKNHI